MTAASAQRVVDREMQKFLYNAKMLQQVSNILNNIKFDIEIDNKQRKTHETTVVISLLEEEAINAEDIEIASRE